MKIMKKWNIDETVFNDEKIGEIKEEFGVTSLTAKLLLKNFDKKEDIRDFLDCSIEKTHSPFQLKNIDKGIERLNKAAQNNEKILVYGDRDVDGITSTALSVQSLEKILLPENIYFWIPLKEEGYGMNAQRIEEFKNKGVSLVLSVDCGITDFDAVNKANELGVDVIITDHHEPLNDIPDAYAVIDPKLPACAYPYKMISGCAVAAKFFAAYFEKYTGLNSQKFIQDNIDLIGLSTFADVVPLTDENRIFAKLCLKDFHLTTNPGLKFLMKVINFKPGKYGYTNRDFTWTLCPLLNAPGRMGKTDLSLRLLLEKEEEKVKKIVFEIKRLNDQRKDLTSQNTQVVLNEVFEQNDKDNFVYVVSVSGIPHGVTGIIGSRLKETYGRPVFLFIEEDGLCQGMGRSVEGFDLIDALETMKDLFIKYGGHRQAAGVSMKKEDLPEFRKRINEKAKQSISEEDLIPQISIDLNAGFEEISIQTVRELFILEPFGMGNPEPLFATLGGEIMDIFWMGDRKQHLKIRVRQNKKDNDVLMWNAPEKYKSLKPGSKTNICYGLSVNEFRGTERLQLMLEDMKLC